MDTTTQEPVAQQPGFGRAPLPATIPAECVPFAIVKCTRVERNAAAADGTGDVPDGDEPTVYRVVLSNERPIDRSWGRLTWVHEKSAIDMAYAKNGLSLLLEHGHRTGDQLYANVIDPELHIGVIENIELNGSQLEGDMRFSSSSMAQQVAHDVEDGTRRYVSLSMVILKLKQTKAAAKEGEVNEYQVTRWMPVEGSIVSIPANPTARVKNSAGAQEYPVELESDTPEPEVHHMSTNAPVTPEAPATVTDRAAVESAVSARNKANAMIVQLCNDQGYSAKASEFIERGLSLEQCGLELLKHKSERGEVKGVAAEIREKLSLKDRKRFSVSKALNEACAVREGHGKMTGVEAEVHSFVSQRAREAGIQEHNGVFITPEILDSVERHAMTSKDAAKGAELVFDQPGGFIEYLRADSVCAGLGAQVLSDLVGNIPFAKQQGDITVSFPGENPANAVTPTDVATGIVTLSGKTMMGAGVVSRQLLKLASYDADNMLMGSFAAAHGLAFDRQGIHGSGAAGQCTGVYAANDVGAVDFGSTVPTWQKVLDLISAVGVANAHKGSLAFLTTVGMAAKLKNVLVASTAGSTMIWQGRIDDGNIDGYKAVASNQASSTLGAGADHAIIFANWREMIFGLWGGLEIVVDPYTSAGKGLVNYTSFQMGDVILRHGQSFAKANNARLA